MITKQELKLIRYVAEAAIAAGREITLEVKDRDYASKALNGAISDTHTVEQRVTLIASETSSEAGLKHLAWPGEAEPEE